MTIESRIEFPEPHTEAELAAIAILKDTVLETDEDYRRLALLIDDIGAEYLEDENSD